jgi:hypothetical protein
MFSLDNVKGEFSQIKKINEDATINGENRKKKIDDAILSNLKDQIRQSDEYKQYETNQYRGSFIDQSIVEANLDMFITSKLRISKMITENYTHLVGPNGQELWVMNLQIALWKNTFQNFDINNFSQSFFEYLKIKEERKKKYLHDVEKYITSWGLDDLSKAIDSEFGVDFSYFDNLIINNSNKEGQKTIRELKETDNYDMLYMLPMSIYQKGIANTIFDFDSLNEFIDYEGINPWQYIKNPFQFDFIKMTERSVRK